MAQRSLERVGGVFRRIHEARIGHDADVGGLDLAAFAPALVERARRTWQERVRTELQSVQIMTRFLEEVVAAGDPYETYAVALDLIEDEVHHVGLCASVCEALGAPALLPDPLSVALPETFRRAPMRERALATAITMLLINEAISVAYIADLRDRCTTPAIRRVLDATLGDEELHEEVGVEYVRLGLARFPESTLGDWRHLAATTLAPHERFAQTVLAGVPNERRRLDAWPDDELVPLGLFSPERQALVFEAAKASTVLPRLRALGLA